MDQKYDLSVIFRGRIVQGGLSRTLMACLASAVLLASNIAFIANSPIASAVAFEADTAMDVNGSAQYGATGNSTALRTFNAMTIEFWLMPQVTCTGNIVAKNLDYAVYCDTGNLSYAFGGTSTSWVGVTTSIKLPTNEWHHVAVARVASTATAYIYIDGQLYYTGTADGAGTSAIKSTTTSFLNIGARNQSTTYFNGLIDEVRIFNVQRTEAQVASDMHTWGNMGLSSVVGYYDFNNVTGSTVTNKATAPDASSDLTLTGSPTFVSIESSTVIGDQTVTTFPRSYLNSNGGWYGPDGVTKYRALIVAGGGGGGSDEGGGGGGGGFIDSSTLILAANSPIAIDVGQGGRGANGNAAVAAYGDEVSKGANGQNSLVGTVTAIGGGGGGSSMNVANDPARNGSSGGSGGGGAGEGIAGHAGGTGTAGQGFDGGVGINASAGGGGGGASEAGNTNGNFIGGDGLASNITGTSVTYAGGGGGGNGNTAAAQYAGGAGGGGKGGSTTLYNADGTEGLGGGGGGGGSLAGGYAGITFTGGNGGSGIVILRYNSFGAIAVNSLSFSVTPTKSTSTTITAIINVAGKVRFFAKGAKIPACLNRTTSGSAPNYTVTCTWRPAVHGSNVLSLAVTPTDSAYSATILRQNVTVIRRSTPR